MLEAGLVGVIGSALGIVLGSVLARSLVGAVTQTINDLYFSLAVRQTAVGPEVLAAGAALGIGVAVVAAMGPASEALRTRPRLTLDRAELEGSALLMVE